MSLILKGIDLPKDDSFCMMVGITNAGSDITIFYKDITKEKEHRGIEAIQIPTPHGRLIDGDKIQDKAYERYFNNTISSYGLFEVNRAIEDAPTILEAEK